MTFDNSKEPEFLRAYVDGKGVSVARNGTALDAVTAANSEDGEALMQGRLRLSDSRGLPIDPESPVYGGAIYRVHPVRSSVGVSENNSGEIS